LKNLLAEIEAQIGNLTKSQRRIANYILRNPMRATFSTVDEIAEQVETSTATVVRFATHFNLSGFTELQKILQGNLQKQLAPSTRLEANFRSKDTQASILANITSMQIDNIQNTYNYLDSKIIDDICKMIVSSNYNYVIGSRSCYSVAHFLAYNLNRIIGNTDLIDVGDSMTSEKLYRIKTGDVFIAITLPRYVNTVLSATKIAKKQGAQILAITDSYLSSMAEYSNYLLSAEIKSYDFHNSIISSMYIAEVLISTITINNYDSVKKRLAEEEKILTELNIHNIK
jgi:DNA-binding MurR/RpiR family transcriptional regulator